VQIVRPSPDDLKTPDAAVRESQKGGADKAGAAAAAADIRVQVQVVDSQVGSTVTFWTRLSLLRRPDVLVLPECSCISTASRFLRLTLAIIFCRLRL
jgi:hypothetical protein